MGYYRRCPQCGCYLDPGESCDCVKEKAAASAANTDNGKVEKGLPTNFSTSNINRMIWRNQA